MLTDYALINFVPKYDLRVKMKIDVSYEAMYIISAMDLGDGYVLARMSRIGPYLVSHYIGSTESLINGLYTK